MSRAPLQPCTVALRSELPNARVLARCIAGQSDGPPLVAVVLDGREGDGGGEEPLEVLPVEQLGLEAFDDLAALLPAPTLRAAVRAWLLRTLWHRADGPVLYLDPTSRPFAPLDDLERELRDCDLLLTPALTAPPPEDGRRPDRAEIATWDAFDQGMVGLGVDEVAGALVEWWAESSAGEAETPGAASGHASWWLEEARRLRTADLLPAPGFAAGRWLDLAAGMAPRLAILRNAGWNVGYWSLGGRSPVRAGDGLEVDGVPVRCFNFRGFDPSRSSLLSRHQDRISLADEPALAELCASYAAELEREGAAEPSPPYAYERLPDGTTFGPRLRALYREWRASGSHAAPVFEVSGQGAFFDWLREPVAPGGAQRYLYAAYLEREDLHRAMPAGEPGFAERLGAWARESGLAEMDLAPALVPGAATRSEPAPPAPGRRLREPIPFDAWGVNVAGYHRADFAIAEVGRLLVEALDARGIPLLPIHDLNLEAFKPRAESFATLGPDAAAFPINLFTQNGDHTAHLAAGAGRDLFEGRYSIGYWAWEADRLPADWLPGFDLLDEIWTPSAYVAETVSAVSPLPVLRVGQPIKADPAPPLDRGEWDIPEGAFLFLYLFDFASLGGRKNPLGLVEAFKRAFPPGSGAALLLKTSFAPQALADFEELRRLAAEHPDIRVADRRVSPRGRDSLLAGCDCYVSLHRSEGFGRTPAEAMARGKPVIATAHGGTTDFMTAANSYPVACRLVEVGPGNDPYPADAHWAEPDTADAASLMRQVFDNPEEARERGRRGRETIRERYGVDAVGAIMEARLSEIRSRFLAPRGAPPPATRRAPLLRRILGHGRPERGTGGIPAPGATAALLAQQRVEQRRLAELEQATPASRD